LKTKEEEKKKGNRGEIASFNTFGERRGVGVS
jgi:hypothetical protein